MRSPCSVQTLNYTFTVPDLQINAVGLPISFDRTYDTRRFLDGILGIGWFPKYGVSVHVSSLQSFYTFTQYVYVVWSDLRRSTFVAYYGNYPGPPTFTPTSTAYYSGVPGSLTFNSADFTWEARPEGGREIFKFGFYFNPLSLRSSDSTGVETVYTFDGNGRVIRVANSLDSSRRVDIVYGANGRISSVTDPTGRSVQYGYDTDGYLTTVTNPLGQITTYAYTATAYRQNKALARITDHWGRVITDVTYFPNSNTVKSYTENGETWTYARLPNSKTSKTDSSGRQWIHTFAPSGYVTNDQDPSGHSKLIGFNAYGLLSGVTDEVGVFNGYIYNSNYPYYTMSRRWLDNGGPNEVRFEYAYDPNFPEKPISITPHKPDDTLDPNWQGWQYDYYQASDPAPGALHHVYRVHNDGVTQDLLATYEYNANGQITRFTSATGGITDFGYDGVGNLTSVTAPSNNDAGSRPVTHYGYDALGRVTSVTDPLGKVTTYGYDALDRVTSVTLPKPSPSSTLNFTTAYSYDNFDAVTALTFTNATDPNGIVTKQGYDQFGQVVRAVDGAANVTIYSFSQGLLASVTDANGNTTSYTYDNNRRLQKTTFPDGAFEQYTHTGDGLLNQKTDRKNQTITYAYDHLKRLASKTYPGGSSISYTYQGQKLTQIVDTSVSPSETHTFAYDSSYRLQSETQASRGTITRTYNADDTAATTAVQSGPATTYTYYPDSSLDTIQWSPVSGNFKYTYTLPGQYQAITFPNGQTRNFTYDDQGRLTQLANLASGGVNIATYAYGYDLNYTTGQNTMLGQRVSLTATVPSQGLSNHLFKYEYDPLYELDRVTYPNVAPFNGEMDSWAYDAIGNRLTSTINGVATNYAYQRIGSNPLNWQRLTNDGANAYTYDANGSTITRTGFTFGWSYDNRMTSISGGVTASYAYDYQGRRSSRTAGSATSYFYDGLNLAREVGSSSADYVFGPGIDEPLAMSRGGQIYYYETDAHGSIVALTNSAATVQNAYLYDAWGQVRSQTGSLSNPFTFTSRELGEAGLDFYRARHYQPAIGRFLQEDPEGIEIRRTSQVDRVFPLFALDGLRNNGSVYAYVNDSPLAHRDPSGRIATTLPVWVGIGAGATLPAWAVGAAVAGTAAAVCYAIPSCRQEMKCFAKAAADAGRCLWCGVCPGGGEQPMLECFKNMGENYTSCRRWGGGVRPYPDPCPSGSSPPSDEPPYLVPGSRGPVGLPRAAGQSP